MTQQSFARVISILDDYFELLINVEI